MSFLKCLIIKYLKNEDKIKQIFSFNDIEKYFSDNKLKEYKIDI